MAEPTTDEFTAVAREQVPWLYSLAHRFAGDEAEEVVRECLVKARRGFGELQDARAAPAWFRQILLDCIRDRSRREAGLPRATPLAEEPEEEVHHQIADQALSPWSDYRHLDALARWEEEDLRRVLDRVKALYRAPLVLVHLEGFSPKQVARMFGVPQDTVQSWLHHGRKLFERELWKYAAEHDLLTTSRGAGR